MASPSGTGHDTPPGPASVSPAPWEEVVRLTATAPITAMCLAEDIIYAFLHGWIDLPTTTSATDDEASERLTRLYAVKRHVETNRAR